MSFSSLFRLTPAGIFRAAAIAASAFALFIMTAPASAQWEHRRGARDGRYVQHHRVQRPPVVRHRPRPMAHMYRPQMRPVMRERYGYRPMVQTRRVPIYAAAPVYGRSMGTRWVSCAREGGVCRTPYPTTVRYGAHGQFSQARAAGPIRCSNSTFGDPIYGVGKSCSFLAR